MACLLRVALAVAVLTSCQYESKRYDPCRQPLIKAASRGISIKCSPLPGGGALIEPAGAPPVCPPSETRWEK